MKIILIAGGRGTRLAISAKDKTKALVDVAGKPILAHQIEHARQQGFADIRVSLGYRAEQIITWLTEHAPDIEYVVESEPLGTGGGIKLAAQGLTGPFVAVNADNLADFDFRAIAARASETGNNVLVAHRLEDASGGGVLEIDATGHHIRAFREKPGRPEPGYISAGAYVLDPVVFASMPDAFSIEHDLFPRLAESGKLSYHVHSGQYWFDSGTEERLAAVRKFFEIRNG